MDPIPYRTLDPSFQGDLVDRVQERLLNGSKIAAHGRRESVKAHALYLHGLV